MTSHNRLVLVALLLAILGGIPAEAGELPSAPMPVSLAGAWRFQFDPHDAGIRDHWFTKSMREPNPVISNPAIRAFKAVIVAASLISAIGFQYARATETPLEKLQRHCGDGRCQKICHGNLCNPGRYQSDASSCLEIGVGYKKTERLVHQRGVPESRGNREKARQFVST